LHKIHISHAVWNFEIISILRDVVVDYRAIISKQALTRCGYMKNDLLNNQSFLRRRCAIRKPGFFMRGSRSDCERGKCQKPLHARLKKRLQKKSAGGGERKKTRSEVIEICERMKVRSLRYFSPLLLLEIGQCRMGRLSSPVVANSSEHYEDCRLNRR